jgi:hypothetical protein
MKYRNHIPKKNKKSGSISMTGQNENQLQNQTTRKERQILKLLEPISHLRWFNEELYNEKRKVILSRHKAKLLGISNKDLEILELLTD